MSDDVETPEAECALCGKALAVVGLLIAAAFLYISVDVLTNGGVTKMFTRSVAE
jgi:hypothetical protein